MIYPTAPDLLLIRCPPDDDGRAGSQNEGWDISSFRVGAAQNVKEAAVPPSKLDQLHHTAVAAETEAASPLDGCLSSEHHEHPLGFTISIPSSNKNEHKLSLPASISLSECVQVKCDESIVSELTLMTYRAELTKLAINVEFEKFRQQKKQQGVEAHPQTIRTMFSRNMMSSDIQKSITSFINIASAKMKAETRQDHHLEEVEEEDESSVDSTINTRADELIVDFGVRPTRSIPHEITDENTTTTRTRPSYEDRLTPLRQSQQPSQTFNIHKVLQDRLRSARLDKKKVTATNKAYQAPRVQIVWNKNYGYVCNKKYGYRQKLSYKRVTPPYSHMTTH